MSVLETLEQGLNSFYRGMNRVFRGSIASLVPRVKDWIARHKERREDKREERITKLLNFKIAGEEVVTVPNLLSALRPFLMLLILPMRIYGVPLSITVPLLVVALLTDKYDGTWAELDGHTRFGEFFDPLCDKLAILIFIIPDLDDLNPFIMWPLLTFEALLFAVAIGAVVLMHRGTMSKETSIKSNIFGKTKFAAECAGLCFLALAAPSIAEWCFAVAIPFALLSVTGKVKELAKAKLA